MLVLIYKCTGKPATASVMITEHVSAWAAAVRDPLREQKWLRGEMSSDWTDVAARHGPLWRGLVPGKPGHLGSEPLSHRGPSLLSTLAVVPGNRRRERANSSGFPEALADCLCPVRNGKHRMRRTRRTRRTRRARRGCFSSAHFVERLQSWPCLPQNNPQTTRMQVLPLFCN